VQLQRSLPELKSQGLGIAAISYDPPATLKAFADQHGITFPLLSDTGSDTIKRYTLLNASATGRMAGIPYPGTFVLDAKGVVVSRAFEESYTERATAASLLARVQKPGPGAAGTWETAETPHLKVIASASDAAIAPGARFSLMVDVIPKPKMHVYSPEQKDYIPISLSFDAKEGLTIHAPRFPKPEKLFFKPLEETQLVFSKPFRIVQEVTLPVTAATRERASAAGATLAITATLRYQACDDAICYLPVNVPLRWTIGLKPLER
jgi:DsbC/DsbD-like thiol-disulfide interchange protein